MKAQASNRSVLTPSGAFLNHPVFIPSCSLFSREGSNANPDRVGIFNYSSSVKLRFLCIFDKILLRREQSRVPKEFLCRTAQNCSSVTVARIGRLRTGW